MWAPNSIPVPKKIIQAECDQQVPAGTTLAIAVFMMLRATDSKTAMTIAVQHAFDQDAAATAWTFLKNGQIVIGGENGNVEIVEYPKKNDQNEPPTGEPEDPDAYTGLFLKYFPNEVAPLAEQIDILAQFSLTQVDDALYQMAYSGGVVKTPITLLLWKLRNETPEKHKADRKRLERKGLSDGAIVNRAIREADAIISTLEPPKATEAGLLSLREKKERLQRGRPQ